MGCYTLIQPPFAISQIPTEQLTCNVELFRLVADAEGASSTEERNEVLTASESNEGNEVNNEGTCFGFARSPVLI